MSTDNGTTWTARTPASVDSPLIIAGLTNAVTYQLRLRAVNTAGPGTPSTAITVTPRGVPGAPRTVTATPGAGTATVSWQAPASDGGTPVTGYTATSAPAGKTCTTTGALTCEVTELANATTYTFTVTATNTAGTSPASDPSPGVTPRTTPDAPTTLVGTAGDRTASVAFVAPASDGGAPVTNYEVSTDNGTTWTARTPASVDSPLIIAGLTNAVTYQLRLRAVNTAGPGTPSTAITVTPRGVPGAPRTVTATPGAGTATVSWQAPASDGGTPVTGYTATSAPAGKTCTTTGALTCEVTGLANPRH